MYGIQADSIDFQAKHKAMTQELISQIIQAAERSKDILVQEVRQDLERKILRPRESAGELSDAIDGEVIRREGSLIIGVGNIEKMNAEAPYWRLQEKGGPISVRSVPGYFVGPSGQRVPFDQSRAPASRPTPHGFVPTKFSQDIFVYDIGKAGHFGEGASIMWIHGDVKPKRYFEAGEFEARLKVLREFAHAFRKVLG
jgi:hypothetical protein